MREIIQSKLNELTNIESGKIVPDDVIVENTTYFGYDLSKNYMGSDLNKNRTYRQNITGYVTRLLDMTENTQEIVDNAVEDIIEKLKELNFKCNSRDINLTDNIIKTQITGYGDFNEINNKFII